MKNLIFVMSIVSVLIGCSDNGNTSPEENIPIVIEDEVLGYGEFVIHCKPYVQFDGTYPTGTGDYFTSGMEYQQRFGYQESCEKTCSINFDAEDAVTGETLGLVAIDGPYGGTKFVYAEDNIIPAGETRHFTLAAGYYFGYIKREFFNCSGYPSYFPIVRDYGNDEGWFYTAADEFNIEDGSTYMGEY